MLQIGGKSRECLFDFTLLWSLQVCDLILNGIWGYCGKFWLKSKFNFICTIYTKMEFYELKAISLSISINFAFSIKLITSFHSSKISYKTNKTVTRAVLRVWICCSCNISIIMVFCQANLLNAFNAFQYMLTRFGRKIQQQCLQN